MYALLSLEYDCGGCERSCETQFNTHFSVSFVLVANFFFSVFADVVLLRFLKRVCFFLHTKRPFPRYCRSTLVGDSLLNSALTCTTPRSRLLSTNSCQIGSWDRFSATTLASVFNNDHSWKACYQKEGQRERTWGKGTKRGTLPPGNARKVIT